ncbi:acetylornithine deacetylase [Acidiphilium sp. AL]|uniref:Acetylornithine deacetylase n=1 Tax=Acidiphilium iwatense TaxID=768198 RepID=A0ABS9E130_9PROT|nr:MULTISPECIES: acetylornithine deacetylase [Acidiphilium]MCF3948713.1 acetylornithine deacetylase [Acidiphilium iwatense]MCU4160378.1 acetylornithine deacetylase [Acidiphilium sp. AL]
MESTVETLARLVSVPTISRTPNDALIAYVADRLRVAGGRVSAFPGENPGTSNLLASFGPDNEGGIVLSGHGDVVPVDGQVWSSDPFVLTERDDRLHARGAVDMKGFVACMLTAAERAVGTELSRPLHLAISCDEEIGCVGVRPMLERLAAEGFRASGCIIGEPTGLAVAIGHKGKVAGCICCRGEAAHSANPTLGCNAINLAAAMVRETEELQAWLRAHGTPDAAYALPYSTVHIGTIKGGTALNIVPDACDMEFEIRFLPGDSPDDLLARLSEAGGRLARNEIARGRHAAVEMTVQNAYPGLHTPEDAPIAALARAAAGNATSTKLSFGTEAGLFNDTLGLPAVVCGPGSIDRAHKPDEYITKDELAACDAFLDRVVTSLR